MKATNILRDHICALERMILVFDEYAMYKSRDESKKAVQELTQVITELEDLQNRTCKNCKFGITYHFDDKVECFKIEADTQGMYFSNDFCCNKWEQK